MLRFLRARWRSVVVGVLALGLTSAWMFARDRGSDETAVVARVKRGEFRVVVTTSGELRARKFVQINVPQNAQQAGAYQMKIASIVPEGTVVHEGDNVAEIDRSTLASQMQDVSLALQKAQAQFESAMLDTALNLSTARETMHNNELALEEKQLAREQAAYEAPSVKRQIEIDFEKARRAVEQGKGDYTTREEQAKAKMREVGSDLQRQQNRLKVVQEVLAGFTIKAPASGMVIYVKEWNGKKRVAGSQVTAWDPGVATLPDLSQMESITYVNEIDVRKIAVGQPALVTLDADPAKKLAGKVISVANVGEQRPNTDAKVFEVHVVVTQSDTTLRPGMTTGNAIETSRTGGALYVPIEALSADGVVPFVYKRTGSGVIKQEVVPGTMNENEAMILAGLQEDDRVLLTIPPDHDHLNVVRLPAGSVPPVPPTGGDTALKKPLSLPRSVPKPRAPASGPPPAKN